MAKKSTQTTKKSTVNKASVYSTKGESVGTVTLNPEIFGRDDVKDVLIHQVVNSLLGNSRNTVAATKDRSAVRGGGKKPWKQKGTGRARAGSIRSPLWKGGGVTFGPTPARNFTRKINRHEKRLVMFGVLSDRLANGKLTVIEKIEVEPKTKSAVKLLDGLQKKLKTEGKGILILTAEKNDNLVRAVRNIPEITARQASDFGVLDILRSDNVFVEKEAVAQLEKTYLKNEK